MQMVEEVTEATAWVMEKCKQYGGSAKKVCLVGHSAGAQLCLMALLCLVKKANRSPGKSQELPAKVIGVADQMQMCFLMVIHVPYKFCQVCH